MHYIWEVFICCQVQAFIIHNFLFLHFLGLSSDEEDESCPSSECESRESSAGSTRGTRRLPSIPRPPHTPKTRRAEGRPKRSQYALSPLSLDIPNGHCKSLRSLYIATFLLSALLISFCRKGKFTLSIIKKENNCGA